MREVGVSLLDGKSWQIIFGGRRACEWHGWQGRCGSNLLSNNLKGDVVVSGYGF